VNYKDTDKTVMAHIMITWFVVSNFLESDREKEF